MNLRTWGLHVALCVTFLLGSACKSLKLEPVKQAVSMVTAAPSLDAISDDLPAGHAIPLAGVGLSGSTAILAWFGQRGESTSTLESEPLSDAIVSVRWSDNLSTELCNAYTLTGNPGTYIASSVASSGCAATPLTYVAGATYTTQFSHNDSISHVEVTAPAPLTAAYVTWSPALASTTLAGLSVPAHTKLAPLTISWTGTATARFMFVTVWLVEMTGADMNAAINQASDWQVHTTPVFDNLPRTAEDLLTMLLAETATEATIDGAYFQKKGLYIVVLTSAELSGDSSEDLGLDSGAFAGAGYAKAFFVVD